MREFLAATRFCDRDHPGIRAALASLTAEADSDVDLAVRLFEFVRDTVVYMFGPWGVLASATLAEREGTCTNKSNLLIALLRAAGIPAGYGILHVNPREYYGVIAPEFLKPLGSIRSSHIYAAVFLNDRWVRCDPSSDAAIAAKTAHFNRQTRLIKWDGRQDALDFLQPQHVYGDLGLRADIDDLLAKPARHAQPTMLATLNDYVRFIREQPPFPSSDALIAAYTEHLHIRRGPRA